MSVQVMSAAVVGLQAHVVEVEAAHTFGLKNFFIVGLPDLAIKEARERVEAAMKFSGLAFPRGRVAVNLAPGSLKKTGTAYDLPMALAVLAAIDGVPLDSISHGLFVGELALDGRLRPVPCTLLIANEAKQKGITNVYVPRENAAEAALVPGICVYPVPSLSSLVRHLQGTECLVPAPKNPSVSRVARSSFDMEHVRGQEAVKRALEIAAAGSHNLLMSGPPGSGKTMLARTIPSILPRMTHQESMEVTTIHSVADTLRQRDVLVCERPFRSPHHTSSGAALVGGGTNPRPGEISLAHRGVLFLDELPEFHRSVLENLRQPLEDGVVTVARAAGTVTFPARFMLLAAMNPCPCGFVSDPTVDCVCAPPAVARYRKKISGPLLDRIDMMVEVPRVPFEKLASRDSGESSEVIQTRVERAREAQQTRLSTFGLLTNSEMSHRIAKISCGLGPEPMQFLKSAVESMKLSARGFTRVLRVARTIADLADERTVLIEHLAEALQYRPNLNQA